MQWGVLMLAVAITLGYQGSAFYITTDYYMSDKISDAWGGVCGFSVEDACAFVNSHINNYRMYNYSPDQDCTMTLDGGSMRGALFRITFRYFRLQANDSITGNCTDYLEFYDDIFMNETSYIGRYCGDEDPDLNSTGMAFPTQRYLTVKFVTDGSACDDGFQFKAIRSEPAPCQDDEYHCRHENRCIDGRLECDGTDSCLDGQDEDDCSGIQRFIGYFLGMGTSGMVLCFGYLCMSCLSFWSVFGALTCCRDACKKCCCCICRRHDEAKVTNITINNMGAGTEGGVVSEEEKTKKVVDDESDESGTYSDGEEVVVDKKKQVMWNDDDDDNDKDIENVDLTDNRSEPLTARGITPISIV